MEPQRNNTRPIHRRFIEGLVELGHPSSRRRPPETAGPLQMARLRVASPLEAVERPPPLPTGEPRAAPRFGVAVPPATRGRDVPQGRVPSALPLPPISHPDH